MGGFTTAAAKAAKPVAKGLGEVLSERLGRVGNIFEEKTGPEGKMFGEDIKNIYTQTYHAAREAGYKQALARTATNPAPINIGEIERDSRKVARHALMGPNDTIGVMTAQAIHKKYGLLAAQSFSDAVAFVLHDHQETEPIFRNKKIVGFRPTGAYSPFKKRVVAADVPLMDVKPTYQRVGERERKMTAAIHSALAPFVMIPHLSTVFNGLLGTTPQNFAGGLYQALKKTPSAGISDFEQQVITGSFAESHLRNVNEHNLFKATGVPNWRRNSTAHFLYKMFHQPGFSVERDYTLLSGAHTGRMVAEDAAYRIAKNPNDRHAAAQLVEFGLDPKSVAANKGQLTTDEYGRAIFKFVNEHYFTDNTLERSMLLQGTPVGRVLGTFHGYVSRQMKLMYRAMSQTYQRNGAGQLMQNIAIMSLLFPAMGEGIKTIQQTLRGQALDLPKDVENIRGKHGAAKAAETYLEAMAHVGAFGIFGHVLRGSLTYNLLGTAAGPAISTPFTILQDVGQGGKKTLAGKNRRHINKNFEPLERDLLFDTPGVNVIGQMLTHRILPTAKEHPRHEPIKQIYEYFNPPDEAPPEPKPLDRRSRRRPINPPVQ